MRIEFPLREVQTEFGDLADPTIDLRVKTRRGYRRFRFLIDTGADFTMMPRSSSRQLGINLETGREMKVTGIEGSDIEARLSEITVQLGGKEFQLPCLFSSNEHTPYLIGRMGFFQLFSVTFDNRYGRIILDSVKEDER